MSDHSCPGTSCMLEFLLCRFEVISLILSTTSHTKYDPQNYFHLISSTEEGSVISDIAQPSICENHNGSEKT